MGRVFPAGNLRAAGPAPGGLFPCRNHYVAAFVSRAVCVSPGPPREGIEAFERSETKAPAPGGLFPCRNHCVAAFVSRAVCVSPGPRPAGKLPIAQQPPLCQDKFFFCLRQLSRIGPGRFPPPRRRPFVRTSFSFASGSSPASGRSASRRPALSGRPSFFAALPHRAARAAPGVSSSYKIPKEFIRKV